MLKMNVEMNKKWTFKRRDTTQTAHFFV